MTTNFNIHIMCIHVIIAENVDLAKLEVNESWKFTKLSLNLNHHHTLTTTSDQINTELVHTNEQADICHFVRICLLWCTLYM